jgi:hypothetical protein
MELQVRRLVGVETLQLLTLLLVVTLPPASCCGGQVEPGPVLVPVHVSNTKAGVPFPRKVLQCTVQRAMLRIRIQEGKNYPKNRKSTGHLLKCGVFSFES